MKSSICWMARFPMISNRAGKCIWKREKSIPNVLALSQSIESSEYDKHCIQVIPNDFTAVNLLNKNESHLQIFAVKIALFVANHAHKYWNRASKRERERSKLKFTFVESMVDFERHLLVEFHNIADCIETEDDQLMTIFSHGHYLFAVQCHQCIQLNAKYNSMSRYSIIIQLFFDNWNINLNLGHRLILFKYLYLWLCVRIVRYTVHGSFLRDRILYDENSFWLFGKNKLISTFSLFIRSVCPKYPNHNPSIIHSAWNFK